jgi:hypothetical protein
MIPMIQDVPGQTLRTKEVVEKIIALGHKDPLVTLSELQNSASDEGIRATAANMLAPYLHSKMGTTPVPATKIYLETEIHLPCPEPKSIEQVNANIWYLHQLKLTGQIDQAWSDNLINDQRILGNNILDRDKLVAQGQHTGPQEIHVTGGLPPLPAGENHNCK